MRDLHLLVGGMGCRHCVREVTARLRDVPGVERIVADATTNRVLVTGAMSRTDVVVSGTTEEGQRVDRGTDNSAFTAHRRLFLTREATMSSTPSSAGSPSSRRWLALGLIAAAQFMVIMDTSIIGVALPQMQAPTCSAPAAYSASAGRHSRSAPSPPGWRIA